jgi:hypothetical protein
MRPDPESQDVLAITNTQRPSPQADANRENGTTRVNLPQLKGRMEWIDLERAVGSPGPVLDFGRQLSKRLPEACVCVGVHTLSGSMGVVRPAL